MSAKRYRRNPPKDQPARCSEEDKVYSLAGDSPVLNMFLKAARHLTERQDTHERLVKYSRDVTIESKRIIFLLHSPITKGKSREDIISEAKERLQKLMKGTIRAIAMELEHAPAYLYSRAYTAGMQEFVEARTLCSFMEHKNIITLDDIRNELSSCVADKETNAKPISLNISMGTISTLLVPMDYMLGLADLSGEVMRNAINGFAMGEIEKCVYSCDMLRRVYTGFLGLYGASQILNTKLNTTRSNLYKVEQALFAYKVRSSELIPGVDARVSWVRPVEEDEGCHLMPADT